MENGARADLVGQTIENRFEITSFLGEGGMARVYRANHKQVDLDVAVKVLKSTSGADSLERFKREAKTVNSLFHPNIIHMYSFGILETGEPYLVLDFIEGKALSDLLEEDKHLPYREGVEIFRQACMGVGHAHERGILHRDLKPSNIMLTSGEGGGTSVKVVDFGIAKPLPCADKEAQQLTKTGDLFGSPIYMSPEQCAGDELDERSDIYSMGCMMYETLMGRPPLLGNTAIATLAMHMYETPPPFKEAAPEIEVPDELEKIVFRAMDKERDSRYTSMQEIEDDLAKLN